MDIGKLRQSQFIEDRRPDWTNVQSGHSFRSDDEDAGYTDLGMAIRIMLGDSTYSGTDDTIQERQRAIINDYFNDPQRRADGGDELRPADLAAMMSNTDPDDLIRWIEELRQLQEFEKIPDINWDFEYD